MATGLRIDEVIDGLVQNTGAYVCADGTIWVDCGDMDPRKPRVMATNYKGRFLLQDMADHHAVYYPIPIRLAVYAVLHNFSPKEILELWMN